MVREIYKKISYFCIKYNINNSVRVLDIYNAIVFASSIPSSILGYVTTCPNLVIARAEFVSRCIYWPNSVVCDRIILPEFLKIILHYIS